MTKVRLINEEIDILSFVETLWNGKWKIVSAIIFSVLSVVGYQSVQPLPNYSNGAEIKAIPTNEAEKYKRLNTLDFFNVSPALLKNLYIEQLDNRSIFEEVIREVLDPKDYHNKLAYDNAVLGFVSSFDTVAPPLVLTKDGSFVENGNYIDEVVFSFNGLEGWKQVLTALNLHVNLIVQRKLQQQFETTLTLAKEKRDFSLEDNTTKIENALMDYERKTTAKLAYLIEQAAIARKIGIAQNAIDAEMPIEREKEKLVVNLGKDETPFYLRGYEAIEKEIELINLRKDTRSFTSSLFELETEQRALKQNKSIERAQFLFALTPIASDKDFFAASLIYNKETSIPKFKNTALVLATLLGGFVGVVFVTFSKAIRSRKEKVAEK